MFRDRIIFVSVLFFLRQAMRTPVLALFLFYNTTNSITNQAVTAVAAVFYFSRNNRHGYQSFSSLLVVDY